MSAHTEQERQRLVELGAKHEQECAALREENEGLKALVGRIMEEQAKGVAWYRGRPMDDEGAQGCVTHFETLLKGWEEAPPAKGATR